MQFQALALPAEELADFGGGLALGPQPLHQLPPLAGLFLLAQLWRQAFRGSGETRNRTEDTTIFSRRDGP
jgi:hypothetical protein